jgi:integrase
MARRPKPWYWKQRRSWFVTISGQRHPLGPDRSTALVRFHELMSSPQKAVVASDQVVAIIDLFLDWTKKHRAESRYHWYVWLCQSFVDSIPSTTRVGDLRPYHLQNWVDGREGDSQSTTRACITAVKRAFAWAEKQGHIDRSPIANVERPGATRREQIVAQAEYDTIRSCVPDEAFLDLLELAWEVGPRPQELVRVESRHVDLLNARWVFPKEEAKGKKYPRVVYLTEPALELTKRWMIRYPEGPIFRNLDGTPWNKSSINSRFFRLAKKTGQKFCLYSFRHSFATRLLEAGVDSLTVAILLGHQDPSMLARVYQHLSHNPEHLLTQVRRAAG